MLYIYKLLTLLSLFAHSLVKWGLLLNIQKKILFTVCDVCFCKESLRKANKDNLANGYQYLYSQLNNSMDLSQ